MTSSIRNRLLFILLPITLVLWTVVGMVIHVTTENEIDELIDAQLAQNARVLLNLMGHELSEEQLAPHKFADEGITEQYVDYSHRYEQRLAFQMWLLEENKIWLRNDRAPTYPLTDRDAGYDNRVIEDSNWRIFVLTDHDLKLQVQVGESAERREELHNNVTMRILIPVALAVPLLALVIWYGVGRAMGPLRNIAADVKNRHPDSLHPIADIAVPLEAKPLVDALNALFKRLQQAFETERRFTADAAHELRTPLAALKTQAQVAMRATEDAERRQALNNVVIGVDRATRLAQQLLTLARIDPTVWVGRDRIRLPDLASEVLAEAAPVALAKNIDLSLDGSVAETVKGDRSMLAIMVRNLVDNAIKYTPAGGKVEVRVAQDGGRILLSVSDSGPGIPPDERARVFERFYRQVGTLAPGSGLGLSIVKRIAELHHADVRLGASSLGGLQVELVFPVAD